MDPPALIVVIVAFEACSEVVVVLADVAAVAVVVVVVVVPLKVVVAPWADQRYCKLWSVAAHEYLRCHSHFDLAALHRALPSNSNTLRQFSFDYYYHPMLAVQAFYFGNL